MRRFSPNKYKEKILQWDNVTLTIKLIFPCSLMFFTPSCMKHARYPNKTAIAPHSSLHFTEQTLCICSCSCICSSSSVCQTKVQLCRILVTWWKDLSPGFNSSIQTRTQRSLGDGSETRRIHQRLSGYFLNIGARTGDTPESQTKSCVNNRACFISRLQICLPGPHGVEVLKGVV